MGEKKGLKCKSCRYYMLERDYCISNECQPIKMSRNGIKFEGCMSYKNKDSAFWG